MVNSFIFPYYVFRFGPKKGFSYEAGPWRHNSGLNKINDLFMESNGK